MVKKIITQDERTKIFNEWLNTQLMPNLKTKEERQRWWVNKVIEFDRITAEEYDVCAGFYVDSDGKTNYD